MESVPWTRVKFRGKPTRTAMKTIRKPRRAVAFEKPAPRSKKQIYQYIVVKPVEPVSVRAGDIDRNDPASMAPRHFKLTPGMMLTSRIHKKVGNSVGFMTFGLIHRADGNAYNRTYDVTVHADTVGEEIQPFVIEDYLSSLASRPPAGSVAPPHPSRVPSGNSGGGRTRRKHKQRHP
jgi:hypothetical protein